MSEEGRAQAAKGADKYKDKTMDDFMKNYTYHLVKKTLSKVKEEKQNNIRTDK